jgi:hypothetical protein
MPLNRLPAFVLSHGIIAGCREETGPLVTPVEPGAI